MKVFENHVLLMFLYSVATAIFFSFLWKEERAERTKFFFLVFSALFFGGIVLSWLMYPFPR